MWLVLSDGYLRVRTARRSVYTYDHRKQQHMFSERNPSDGRFWFHVYPLLLRWIKPMDKRRNALLCSYIAWTYLVLQTSFSCARANNGEGEWKREPTEARYKLAHSYNVGSSLDLPVKDHKNYIPRMLHNSIGYPQHNYYRWFSSSRLVGIAECWSAWLEEVRWY